jgi:hypothetical protein
LDLDWCWYLAVKILGMTEQEFLKSTPKKLFKLAEIHQKMNSYDSEDNTKEDDKQEMVYIDQLF